ncbi:AMP-binding protein [Nocardia sp. alder85J]|uniref:AMP-binding protein n=1 Tax=Nocardia sp. alder85J TaxID=2862949 RepID=UPI001CD23DE2|nr:AMP-binding protein [Nocardia sp. alder85J]MCX4096821.1 AMP-binding protein [Nocardia sp. alder85J]
MRTVPPDIVSRYEAAGWWTRDSLGDLLARGLAAAPDTTFTVHSAVRPWAGTWAEVELSARRLAAGLRARGVEPGDVVAFQLPNWAEAAVVFWASAFLGAVVVPIVHFYRHRELEYILRVAAPKVFVTAAEFGPLRYEPELSAGVPIVGVVGHDFDDLFAAEPMTGVAAVDPGQPAVIAFTSGTTRNPKGVLHSHRSLGCETRQLAGMHPHDQLPSVTAAPVGHFIGMLSAFLIPVLLGTPVTLVDTWNPEQMLGLLEQGLTVGGGVPYYFTSLMDHPDFTAEHQSRLRYAPMGGSSIPAAVSTRLAAAGVTVYRSYGSTEHPSITGSRYTAPEDKRLYTDGVPMPGVEIRLADDGEILSRGPDLCLGYVDDELTATMFDDEGWYHTGDIGILDADGYLGITDRKSDVIIRGGENISALEVEEALLAMPAVAEAAVVAAPDARLGEHAAAVVRLRPGHEPPTMSQLRDHFAEAGLAKQKWPEELHAVDEFPRTPSGKVQKFRLRAQLAAGEL